MDTESNVLYMPDRIFTCALETLALTEMSVNL